MTIRELRKLAVQFGLLDLMKSRGFEEAKKSNLFFFRTNSNNIYQIISFEILSGGENLEIAVFNWVPEMEESYDLIEFPKGIAITNGGTITKRGEIGLGMKLWDLRNKDRIPDNLENIIENIDSIAIPWLDAINTRKDLIAALFVDLKENTVFSARELNILNP